MTETNKTYQTTPQGFTMSAMSVFPHSPQAEEYLIGAILLDSDVFFEIMDILLPNDFFLLFPKVIYGIMVRLHEKQSPAGDLALIMAEMTGREKEELEGELAAHNYLTGLVFSSATSLNTRHYARVIRDLSLNRQVITLCTEAVVQAQQGEIVGEQLIAGVIGNLMAIDSERGQGEGFSPVTEALDRIMTRMETMTTMPMAQFSQLNTGGQTGINMLDNTLGGFRNGRFYVLAGRPGMGKSTTMTQWILNMARDQNKRVGIASLEMTEEENTERMLANLMGLNSERFINGPPLSDSEMSSFIRFVGELSNATIYIDEHPGLTVGQIKARAIRLKAREGIDILFVDHLGKVRPDKDSGDIFSNTSLVSNGLHEIAKELNLPVVALCQLSRKVEGREDKRPTLSDLRNSGEIEQDAHAIIFVYRDDAYNEDSEFPNLVDYIIGKNRSGRTTTVPAYMQREMSRISNLEIRKQSLV